MDTSKSCACGCFIILLNVESLEEAIFFYNFVQSSLPSKIYPIQISWPIYSKFGNESIKVFSSDGKKEARLSVSQVLQWPQVPSSSKFPSGFTLLTEKKNIACWFLKCNCLE